MPDHQLFRKQTLGVYDTTWKYLKGDPDIRSRFWQENITKILCEQELCISHEWFKGRRVLDVGCGGGRWTYGFQKLGCEVTAFDASIAACNVVRSSIAQGNTRVFHANIFNLPGEIQEHKYDLVFAWGVLHHTGDTFQALKNIAALIKTDGILYIYLYGGASWSFLKTNLVKICRLILMPIPNKVKFILFRILLGEYKAGLAMDVLSPTIAHRYSQEKVDAWLTELNFENIVRTIQTNEIYRKAFHSDCSAVPYFLEPSSRLARIA